ncbi:MAG: pyridoxal-phosphate dependent enzyme [Desulfurococcaceae archaeon TW002]
MGIGLRCVRCGYEISEVRYIDHCPNCGGLLITRSSESLRRSRGSGVWAWSNNLYTSRIRPKITLGEGNTPLVKSAKIGKSIGLALYFKDESKNPTGSFIDRGSATLVTALKYFRIKSVVVPSTGDLTISLSTYLKRAGISSKAYIPSSVTLNKAYKTLLVSDKVRFVDSYEEALSKALKNAQFYGTVVLPTNPFLIDGYRTIAIEIIYSLGRKKPLLIVTPIGDGVLALSIHYVLEDLQVQHKVLGVRACRESPLLRDIYVAKPMLQEYLKEQDLIEVVSVCDDEALEASELMIKKEGFLIGPVGASCVAALKKILTKNAQNLTTIALMSGDPLQDPYIIKALLEKTVKPEEHIVTLGFTKIKILEILAYGNPTHPYMLWKELKQKHGLNLSKRSIYKHVEELINLGLLKVVGYEKVEGRTRKVVSITESGLRYLT